MTGLIDLRIGGALASRITLGDWQAIFSYVEPNQRARDVAGRFFAGGSALARHQN